MRFQKWQALGNDYLIFEAPAMAWPLTAARVRRLCDPHLGVGADGILLIEAPGEPGAVARLRIFNPDGSEAELSGNGVREAIMYLRRCGWTDQDTFTVLTAAGEIRPTITGPSTARVDMGQAALSSTAFPDGAADGRGTLVAGGREWRFQHISIGNPQCAIEVADEAELEALELTALGGEIERHELFPARTNVSFFCEREPGVLRARIFERGVGETLSSGTGASGAAVAHVLDGASSPVTVVLDGGELVVEVGEDLRVHLTGWALPVFSGTLAEDFVKELHETQ